MSKNIEFYVGIDPKDEDKFFDFLEYVNEEVKWSKTKVVSSFSDPESYYTFVISGNWDAYRQFYNNAKEDVSWVKSLYHYEE
jgi:hypothetical protein